MIALPERKGIHFSEVPKPQSVDQALLSALQLLWRYIYSPRNSKDGGVVSMEYVIQGILEI